MRQRFVIVARKQEDAFASAVCSSIRGQFDLTDILYQFDKRYDSRDPPTGAPC